MFEKFDYDIKYTKLKRGFLKWKNKKKLNLLYKKFKN